MTPPSRQVHWQRKQKRLGKCVLCRNPAASGSTRCEFHLLQQARLQRKELGQRQWRPGSRGRAPILSGLGINWDEVDFAKTNADLARELGVSNAAVWYQRRKRASTH